MIGSNSDIKQNAFVNLCMVVFVPAESLGGHTLDVTPHAFVAELTLLVAARQLQSARVPRQQGRVAASAVHLEHSAQVTLDRHLNMRVAV